MSSSPSGGRWWALRPLLWGVFIGAITGGAIGWAIQRYLLTLDAVALGEASLFGAVAGTVYVLLAQATGSLVHSLLLRILLAILLVPIVFWLSADLLYSILVKRSYALWEATIERDRDGVRAGCAEYTVGHGSTALLLVHGFGDSPAVWQRMAPTLATKGFTCNVMRLPHFATTHDEYCRTTADEWSAAVLDHLAALRKTHERVIVVGHSLGCAVILDALADHPKAADAVVLIGPLVEIAATRSPFFRPRTWFNIADNLFVFTDRVGLVRPWRDLHDEEALKLIKVDRFMSRAVYRQLFRLLDRNQARAPSLKVPLLMVLAQDDPVVDNAAAERFFDDCKAPMGTLKLLDDSDHMIPMDIQWGEVVHHIERFVEQLPTDG
jgi:carboxylesterase